MADETPAATTDEEAALEEVAAIARRLAAADDLDETLQQVVDLAQDYIEHCDGASLMLVTGGRVSIAASTHGDAFRADQAQQETGEGPCLTAQREHETIVIGDIEADDRWPSWRTEVTELGWRSMLGLRLFVAGDTLGALNLYSCRPDSFDRRSRALGQVFAAHAAIAMKAAASEAGLHQALESRGLIGQAKGVLMERERLTGQQAFDRLAQLSNDHNIKLRELARGIVETGEVPD